MGSAARPVMAGMTPEASMPARAGDRSMRANLDQMAGDCRDALHGSRACSTADTNACSAGLAEPIPGWSCTAANIRPPFAVSGKIAPMQNDFWRTAWAIRPFFSFFFFSSSSILHRTWSDRRAARRLRSGVPKTARIKRVPALPAGTRTIEDLK